VVTGQKAYMLFCGLARGWTVQ